MFESLALDDPTVAGGIIVVFVLAFVRFGNRVVDFLLSYQDSPVEAMEESMSEQD